MRHEAEQALSTTGRARRLDATMPKYDLSTLVERSRKGPCFICSYLGGHPDYEHEPLYSDDQVVAFLSRYPTLLGYTIVAPRAHVIDVTGGELSIDPEADERLGRVTGRVGAS